MQELLKKIKIPVVLGPTASGKTDLAIKIAHKLNGEIISADSMQVYKGIEIASATPDFEERAGINHHLLSFLPPETSFDVVQYIEMAKAVIFDVYSRGKTPILTGGTGLYIDSLMQNIDFGKDEGEEEIESELNTRMEKEGAKALYDELLNIDPQTAKALHPNNKGRLIRALTVYYASGKTMTQRKAESRQYPSPYLPSYIGISYNDRQLLYDNINIRVEKMIDQGLIEEIKKLMPRHGKTSIQAIGHKELMPYVLGELSLDEAKEKLKRETRRYAKRQMTWFKKNADIAWFYKDNYKNSDDFYNDVFSYLEREGFDINQ